MLVLIMTVCSLASPNQCSEARMEFPSSESLMQCMMRAPPYLAQWAGDHPNTRIVRWRCVYPDSEDQQL